jgi:hypothetical protein
MSRHPEPRRPVRVVPTSRPGGGSRLLVELDAGAERAYRRAVAPLTPRIERSLRPGVYANRSVGRGAFRTTHLEPWVPAWERWARRVRLSARGRLVRADVAGFYGSVRERALGLALGPEADAVLGALRSLWDEGVTGLPIGPEPSAILANAVLAVADRALAESGVESFRWVDDWLVPVPTSRAAGKTLSVLERALRELGLELNLAKTCALAPDALLLTTRVDGSFGLGSAHAMMPAP